MTDLRKPPGSRHGSDTTPRQRQQGASGFGLEHCYEAYALLVPVAWEGVSCSPEVPDVSGAYRQGVDATLQVLAGMVCMAVFAGSMLLMLHTAPRTREPSSYSLGNIAWPTSATRCPPSASLTCHRGPIWFLPTFYVVNSALMLSWYLRCRPVRRERSLAATRVVPMTAVARGVPR